MLQWVKSFEVPQVHAGSVTAIAALSGFSSTSESDGSYLILTAGSDCRVNVWSWDVLGPSRSRELEHWRLACAEA